MKRSLADTSTRSTAGCLPVPLFNQKKRTRQPLTSNPLKNEPGIGSGTRSYDFSPTSFGWGTANPEVDELQKAANSGQTELPMGPSLTKPPNASKFNLANAGKTLAACRNRNEYTPLGNPVNSRSGNGTTRKFENFSSSLKTVQEQKHPDNRNPSQLIKTDTYKGQWPVKPNTVSRSLQDHSPAYKFNYNIQQNKMNENRFDCVPEDKSQEISSSQVKTKIKKNSLRILSAVIQSVRYWSQYAYKTALLFEVLGTLDSAVTPGAYGAKNFLLRDGKETLPCVFYEIDRELPRLIRGRVHRCMGNYDAKRNIFKCVSVRPASAQEQNTFQDFVKIADVEMTAYVKTLNEM
ncbi:spermatogenesis-associated protein 22 [Corvus cornix cornix]|uniref:spermatogenesis-associated protein 22 n=1 Tax=Corvus cornix cornix TaxID=932674 RepID=UPI000816656D|nr:PREDICTED: spermatogenesis-associated protein 22 isoform X1 [Corvus brachyrhynchos]XP_019143179.1 spermatogenesis-associated protein 22 [Corvus cornix cornix]